MRGWKVATILLNLLVIMVACLITYGLHRINTLTSMNTQLYLERSRQNAYVELLSRINDENIESWRKKVTDLEAEVQVLVRQIQELTSPSLLVEAWSPERDKLLVVPQLRQGPVTLTVPPGDYLIIPISVGKYEHLAGWGWSAVGKNEDYLDSWLVNSTGGRVNKSGRSFNYFCDYTVSGSSGLGSGTWYIYLSNEFTSLSAKEVTLRVHWN